MEKINKLVVFLKNKGMSDWQIFFTRNIVGDEMETIYNEDGVIVDVCYGWGYLEIFGLTEEEQSKLATLLPGVEM